MRVERSVPATEKARPGDCLYPGVQGQHRQHSAMASNV